jgi:predicted RNA binding protein YcfA (HicA-like mRNA interferase family)
VLEHLGFEQIRQTGSHVVMKKETEAGKIGCVVPLHPELKVGTLSGILKQAQVTISEFIENLRSAIAYRINPSNWVSCVNLCYQPTNVIETRFLGKPKSKRLETGFLGSGGVARVDLRNPVSCPWG